MAVINGSYWSWRYPDPKLEHYKSQQRELAKRITNLETKVRPSPVDMLYRAVRADIKKKYPDLKPPDPFLALHDHAFHELLDEFDNLINGG